MKGIAIRQADGSARRYRNAEFIPAFLMIPEELLKQTNREMITLKRTPRALFTDPETMQRVESDNFLQVVIDAYAYLAWPYMGVHGRMEDYSGYDPFWRIAHATSLWITEMEALGLLPSTDIFYRNTLQTPDEQFGFFPYEIVEAYMETVVPRVMKQNGFDQMYEYVNDHRCHEDFATRPSWDKINFYIRWYHMDTQHPTLDSTEVLRITSRSTPDLVVNADGELEDAMWDRIEAQAFWDSLSKEDQKLLWLHWNDVKQKDVAKALGLATQSAVAKRIQRIGHTFEHYTDERLGFRKPNER